MDARILLVFIMLLTLSGCAAFKAVSSFMTTNKGIKISTSVPIGNKGQGTIGKSQEAKENKGNMSGRDTNKYQNVRTVENDYSVSWSVVVSILGIVFIFLSWSLIRAHFYKIESRKNEN